MSSQCKFALVLAVVATLLVVSRPARGYQSRHPVFPVHLSEDQVSLLKGDVAAVMQFSPEMIDEFIVARTGHYNIDCPNCEAGNPQRVGWQWSVDAPDHLTCGYCGMVFPNDQYPLDRVTTVTDATGTVHDYAYYEGRNGYKHYIMRMPNGHPITVHDAWTEVSQGEPVSQVRDEPIETHLLWAMGQAILGLGRGETGVQANLHFSGAYGHEHADNLDLMLFGGGLEMLSDVGYTHTILRPLANSSLAHNLVVVDEADQEGADGYLEAWGVSGDLLRFCEARAEGAYPQVSQYRRALAVVALPEPGAYLVDVFRVKGGSKHDWLVHGSADQDQQLDCSLALEQLEGNLLPPEFSGPLPWVGASGQGFRTVIEGVHVLYGLLGDLRRAPGDATWSATFSYTEPDMPALRTTVLGQPGTTVYAATLPSIRRARESNAEILNYRMPTLLARRGGPELQSVFAAVHEPYQGASQLTSVEALELREGSAETIGVVCRGDGFCDYHLFGLDATSRMQAAGLPIKATARYAFVRTQQGQVARMLIVDGAALTFGDTTLSAPPAPAGRVLAVRRVEAGDHEDALIVDIPITPRKGKPHERVIVEFGDGSTFGLGVREIREYTGAQSVIALEYRPGFEFSADGASATQTHHPHHHVPGRPRFRLADVADWARE